MTELQSPITVLLVDDDPLVRAGLKLILGGSAEVAVVGEASDGAAAIADVARLRPSVVLMDIRMPVLNGLSATETIVATYGDSVRVIVLTTFDTDDMVLQAVRGGASGFLLKDTPPERLVGAVRSVAAGEPIMSPRATAALMARVTAGADVDRESRARSRMGALTEREQDVAIAVGRGLGNADIAKELYLSVATVKAHVSRLLTKLDAANRVQVAILVHEAGLLE